VQKKEDTPTSQAIAAPFFVQWKCPIVPSVLTTGSAIPGLVEAQSLPTHAHYILYALFASHFASGRREKSPDPG